MTSEHFISCACRMASRNSSPHHASSGAFWRMDAIADWLTLLIGDATLVKKACGRTTGIATRHSATASKRPRESGVAG
eukprot:4940280-Prymnesium_polylepis.2